MIRSQAGKDKRVMSKAKSIRESESCVDEWESYFCDMPEPVLLSIFYYLEVRDVLAAGGTCQRWNRIAKDDWLWRRLFQRDFGLPLNAKIGLRPGTLTYYAFDLLAKRVHY